MTNTSTQLLFLLLALLSLTSSLASAPRPAAHAHGPAAPKSAGHAHAPAAPKHPRAAAPAPSGPPADITKSCSTAQDKDFCVKTLKSNPQSSGKDIKELTFLSMEMAQNKSSEIDGFIATKLRNEESLPDNTDDALHECGAAYDDATAVIEDAISAFFQKNFGDMNKYMTAASNLGDKCEKEFKDGKMKAVIGDRNVEFSKLCGISLALVDAWKKGKK